MTTSNSGSHNSVKISLPTINLSIARKSPGKGPISQEDDETAHSRMNNSMTQITELPTSISNRAMPGFMSSRNAFATQNIRSRDKMSEKRISIPIPKRYKGTEHMRQNYYDQHNPWNSQRIKNPFQFTEAIRDRSYQRILNLSSSDHKSQELDRQFTERVNKRLEEFEKRFRKQNPHLIEQQRQLNPIRLINEFCEAVDPTLPRSRRHSRTSRKISGESFGRIEGAQKRSRKLSEENYEGSIHINELSSINNPQRRSLREVNSTKHRSLEKILTKKGKETPTDAIRAGLSQSQTPHPSAFLTERMQNETPYRKHLNSNIFFRLNDSLPRRMKFHPLVRKGDEGLDSETRRLRHPIKEDFSMLNESLEALKAACNDTVFDYGAKSVLDRISQDVASAMTPRRKVRERLEKIEKELEQKELVQACREAMKIRVRFEMTHMLTIEIPSKKKRQKRHKLHPLLLPGTTGTVDTTTGSILIKDNVDAQ